MDAISKRRIARAATVYAATLASQRDVTAEPRIVRAFRIVYRWRPGTKQGISDQLSAWRKCWRLSINGGTPLRPFVSGTLMLDRHELVRIERAWMVEPAQSNMHSSLWMDLLCAQAQRDAMSINHAKWIMLQGVRDDQAGQG